MADARQSVSKAGNSQQTLYRDAKLAVRAVVGARELDKFLLDRDAVARELEKLLRHRVSEIGLEVVSVGVRDIILPGDTRDLMNRVKEAKKVAEANLIARREYAAAMRSQANAAKLEVSLILMRLRKLAVLERSPRRASSTSCWAKRD